MSKIFEALNRGKGELAELMAPLVERQAQAQAPSPAAGGSAPPQAPPDEGPARPIRTLRLRVPASSPILPFDGSRSHASEQYRILRTKIGQHPKQPRLITVSSAAAMDGKTVTAVNMAGALSLRSEAKVLLLDADFRRSAIHLQLGLPEAPGLADVLSGACSLEDALVHAQEYPNLYVLAAGTPPGNPAELLDSAQWPALCARLRGLFRYIVADSPPVAAVADYDLIQAVSDGVVLVVRPDHTNRDACQKALATVSPAKFLGVLLNCVPEWFLGGNSYSDYYYYSARGGQRDGGDQGVGTTA